MSLIKRILSKDTQLIKSNIEMVANNDAFDVVTSLLNDSEGSEKSILMKSIPKCLTKKIISIY